MCVLLVPCNASGVLPIENQFFRLVLSFEFKLFFRLSFTSRQVSEGVVMYLIICIRSRV